MAMALDSSSSSISEDSTIFKEVDSEKTGPRETSIIIRDHYMRAINGNDQTRTQALSHIDFVVMEQLYTPQQIVEAISRYGAEVKASGAKMTKSCSRFFSEQLYAEFLREDWTPPEEVVDNEFEELMESDPLEAMKKRASGA